MGLFGRARGFFSAADTDAETPPPPIVWTHETRLDEGIDADRWDQDPAMGAILTAFKGDASDGSPLLYPFAELPFWGRVKEKRLLEAFRAQTLPFSWMLLSGEAGSGKSRLAWEFLKELQQKQPKNQAFYVDFEEGKPARLPALFVDSFQNWNPVAETLLVIEGVVSRVHTVRDLLVSLASRAAKGGLAYPVRVLLLERGFSLWYRQLTAEDKNLSEEHALLEQTHYRVPMTLDASNALSDQELWGVMTSLCQKRKKELPLTQEQAIARLEAVDTHRRPLFALMMADALTAHDADWTREMLLRSAIRSQEKLWWGRGGVTLQDLSAVALATICGGAAEGGIPPLSGVTPLEDLKNNGKLELLGGKVYALNDEGEQQGYLKALLPDTIGELFVLDLFSSGALPRERVVSLLEAAWRCEPRRCFEFWFRCIKDYYEDVDTDLWCAVLDAALSGEQMDALCAVHLARAIFYFSQEALGKQEVEEASAFYERFTNSALRAFILKHPEILLMELQTVLNLIHYYGNRSEMNKAKLLFDRLDALRNLAPPSQDLLVVEAKALLDLIDSYEKEGDMESARALYQRMDGLRALAPANILFLLTEAKATLTLIRSYGKGGELQLAQELYGRFEGMRSIAPASLDILIVNCDATVALVDAYGARSNFEAAQRFYSRFIELRRLAPDCSEMALSEAQATENLIAHYGREQKIEQGQALYSRFSAIRASVSELQEPLLVVQGKAALTLILYYKVVGNEQMARSLYDAFEKERQLIPENKEMLTYFASATLNLLSLYGNAGNLTEARAFYERFDRLTSLDPQNRGLLVTKAEAASALIHHYGAAGNMAVAIELYAGFDVIRQVAPESAAVVFAEAKATFDLVGLHARRGELAAARELYAHFKTIRSRFPDNEDILVEEAQAALSLLSYYAGTGDLGMAKTLYDSFEALLAFVSEHQEILVYGAGAVLNLIYLYGATGDLKTAKELYERFKKMRELTSDNPDILVYQAKATANLINLYSAVGDSQTIETLYLQLDQLQEIEPNNRELLIIESQALSKLIEFFRAMGNGEKATQFLERENTIRKGLRRQGFF